MRKFDSTLYFITDSTGVEENDFLEKVEAALKGGVTLLQLREKDRTTREYLSLAGKVHALLMCDKEAIEVQKILPFLSDTWPLCRIGRAVMWKKTVSYKQQKGRA